MKTINFNKKPTMVNLSGTVITPTTRKMKYLLLTINIFICSLLFAQTNTNSIRNTHRNYGYFGLEVGNSYLTSKYNYQPNNSDLLNTKSIKNAVHVNVRFFGGYSFKNKHRLELSIQNLNIKTGYIFTDGNGYPTGKRTIKGSVFLNFGYLFKPYSFKRFNFNFGPHIGFAIAGNSDFESSGSYSSFERNNNGTITQTIDVNFNEIRLHQVFINFGARVNLRLELGQKRKSELFFNTSFYYTPYNVRAYDFNYQINNEPRVYARSSTGIMNWTFSLGYSYKIFGKWADTSNNGYYED